MRRKFFFILFSIFVFGSTSVSAQETKDKGEGGGSGVLNRRGVAQISKGVLNGAAISLAKPAYPPAAKAVRAEGTVSVQVTIDENGNVISAEAVSGHPLLRAASVQAAQQSKFKPTLLENQPVKVTGIIVYNFVATSSPLSLRQIGYTLSLAENSLQWKDFSPNEISSHLPAEWTDEKESLKNLQTYLKNREFENKELEKEKTQTAPTAPTMTIRSGEIKAGEKFKIGSEAVSSASVLRTSAPVIFYKPLDDESIAKVRELQMKIENRLLADEKALWSFRFGKLLGKTKAEIDNADKTRMNLLELTQTMQASPYQFAESFHTEIREISESFQQATPQADARARLEKIIANLAK